jgi:hypothetical protein
MKALPYLLLLALSLQFCSTKKTETTEVASDTVTVDSTLATTPASPQLAFSPFDGFTVDTKLALPDSVNYFLLANQDDLASRFGTTSAATGNPDFLINYVIGVACKPSTTLTTIVLDKVETGESTINVYLTIQRGEQQKTSAKAAGVFAIERRDGFPVMQFFVNGRKDKAIVLVEAQ